MLFLFQQFYPEALRNIDREDEMKTIHVHGRFGNFSAALALVVFLVMRASALFAEGGLTRIADNVYAYTDIKSAAPQNSFGANAGIVIGRDGILVIDTLISAKEAKRFIKDIRAVSDKPIRYVVNSHHHLDHTFGNSEFKKQGAIIIDQENIRKIIAQYDEAAVRSAVRQIGLTDEDMQGTEQWLPALTFTDRLTIDLGDQKVELICHGHTHTEDSVVAFLPDKKILFAGDLLFTNYHTNLMDADLDGWLRALDTITAINATVIIPGHGPISTNKDVQAMKDYLVAFDKKVRELAAQGKEAETIASEIIKAFPERKELAGMVPVNVRVKYLKK